MKMPQADNLQYGNVRDYVDTYSLDTIVIMWKAEDKDEASRAREYISSVTLDDMEVGMYYTAAFGPLAGVLFFAFGEQGIDETDAGRIDDIAAGFPCETELWFGSAEEITQLSELAVPEYVKVA